MPMTLLQVLFIEVEYKNTSIDTSLLHIIDLFIFRGNVSDRTLEFAEELHDANYGNLRNED